MNNQNMRSLLLFFIINSMSFSGWAQANISFKELTHNFGTIKEEAGPVEFTFNFTNTGTDTLFILNVQASCGCTTPGWSKDAVAPGGTGFVKAKYDPRSRPGAFNKTLTVSSNAVTSAQVLYIKGEVTPKPKSISDDFPAQLGALRSKYRAFNFGNITTQEPVMKSFTVFNDGDTVITFKKDYIAPAHITVRFEPASLKPKERGAFIITYDPQGKDDLGFVSDRLIINTDDKLDPAKEYSVLATVEEYFPPMTMEELAVAPRIQFSTMEHDFGTIKEGETVSYNFEITNTGQSDLNIRKTKASCGCTISEPGKDTLAPGQSTDLKVTFNSRGRKGNQYKTVTVFSNDPKGPTQRISFKAKVIE